MTRQEYRGRLVTFRKLLQDTYPDGVGKGGHSVPQSIRDEATELFNAGAEFGDNRSALRRVGFRSCAIKRWRNPRRWRPIAEADRDTRVEICIPMGRYPDQSIVGTLNEYTGLTLCWRPFGGDMPTEEELEGMLTDLTPAVPCATEDDQ